MTKIDRFLRIRQRFKMAEYRIYNDIALSRTLVNPKLVVGVGRVDILHTLLGNIMVNNIIAIGV